MSEEHDNNMAGHDYDGITELDNLLPRWWLWLFWLCIIFAGIYLLYYHVLRAGRTSAEEWQYETAIADKAKAALAIAAPVIIPPADPSTDAATIEKGRAVFATRCFVCHGTQGQGMIGLGPNLTDDYWIHGGAYNEIKHTITAGIPGTAMPTWSAQLKEDEIQAAASYIWAIHGTDVSKAIPPPKPPEPNAKFFPRENLEIHPMEKTLP